MVVARSRALHVQPYTIIMAVENGKWAEKLIFTLFHVNMEMHASENGVQGMIPCISGFIARPVSYSSTSDFVFINL